MFARSNGMEFFSNHFQQRNVKVIGDYQNIALSRALPFRAEKHKTKTTGTFSLTSLADSW